MTEASFTPDFEYERIHEVPAGRPVREFPGTPAGSRSDGLLVRFAPPGEPVWIGQFPFGPRAAADLEGLFPGPGAHKLCVVSGGHATIVDASRPEEFEVVPLLPVRAVCAVPERGLLVLAGPCELVAYRSGGLAWRTGRVAIDGFEIVEVTAGCLIGRADALDDEPVPFRVDLATGEVAGA